MAPVDTRCPRCGFAAADVWREELLSDRRIRRVVCRCCAFVFALTEPPESSPYPFALVHSRHQPAVPKSEPLLAPDEDSLAAPREQREKLQERLAKARHLFVPAAQRDPD